MSKNLLGLHTVEERPNRFSNFMNRNLWFLLKRVRVLIEIMVLFVHIEPIGKP